MKMHLNSLIVPSSSIQEWLTHIVSQDMNMYTMKTLIRLDFALGLLSTSIKGITTHGGGLATFASSKRSLTRPLSTLRMRYRSTVSAQFFILIWV